MHIMVDVFNAGVTYPRGGRKNLLGKRWISRRAVCHVTVQFLDQDGRMISQKNCQKQSADRVYLRNLSYIEQQGVVLGYPDRPEYSDFFSRMEPFFMIGSVGVVVYLFYIIRS
jgi:hypothetical protein